MINHKIDKKVAKKELKDNKEKMDETKKELEAVKEDSKKIIENAKIKASAEFEVAKEEKALKKELKKQAKDVVEGEDKKVYSQAQYDEAVRAAAKQAATDAVKHLRELDKENAKENEQLLKQVAQIKKPKDEALEVEKAIKVAVTQEAGDFDPVADKNDKLKTPIKGEGIMGQMK